MARWILFFVAVFFVYMGGFAFDTLGPKAYAVGSFLLSASGALLKWKFWKKLLLIVPVLMLRVAGKVSIGILGKNMFAKMLIRYGLLNKHWNTAKNWMSETPGEVLGWWNSLDFRVRGYLVLIFAPFLLVLLLVALVIQILRLYLLRMAVEKAMQTGVEKVIAKRKAKKEAEACEVVDTPEGKKTRCEPALGDMSVLYAVEGGEDPLGPDKYKFAPIDWDAVDAIESA